MLHRKSDAPMNRIFILSPARTTGKRAAMALNPQAKFALAEQLRSAEGAAIGDVFAFLSGLYFRGKLAYARRFGSAVGEAEGCCVITSSRGLVSADLRVTAATMEEFSSVPIDPAEVRYREPLARTAAELRQMCGDDCEVVLLGSIATGKYADVLLECFGERLMFPAEFIGRGDMSRGGLMLRAVDAGAELEYLPLGAVASRKGKRPPKLERLPRKPAPEGRR